MLFHSMSQLSDLRDGIAVMVLILDMLDAVVTGVQILFQGLRAGDAGEEHHIGLCKVHRECTLRDRLGLSIVVGGEKQGLVVAQPEVI